jgi:hypothetical protein
MKNRVLVILSNRLDRAWKIRFFDILSKPDGSVLKEVQLTRLPKSAVYDEVWENDDGKTDIDSCTRMKRHYKHALLKQRVAQRAGKPSTKRVRAAQARSRPRKGPRPRS